MAETEDKQGTGPAHQPGTRKGEELQSHGEAGRIDTGESGADRPSGTSTGRMSTSINADKENPIDPASPNMPPA